MRVPVFIVCRDRYTPLVNLIDWLERIGHGDEIYLIDNDSAYEPLLDYYERTEHTVIRTGSNDGHKVGWTQSILRRRARGCRFVYTDPDLDPAGCPDDVFDRMGEVLDRDPSAIKCGVSLQIDDLPAWCRDGIGDWEAPYWEKWDGRVGAFRAPIDTTFALHSPRGVIKHKFQPAYRLPPPYTFRHLPWYVDPHDLSAEEAFYMSRADRSVSNWARDMNQIRGGSL